MPQGVPVRFRPEVQECLSPVNSGLFLLFASYRIKASIDQRNKTRNRYNVEIVSKPYTIPKLFIARDANGKALLTGSLWYVWFRYQGKLIKKRKGLNRIKSYRERKKVGESLADTYHEMLKRGFNPLENDYSKSDQNHLTVETGILKALAIKKTQVKSNTYNVYESHANNFISYCKNNLIAGKPVEDLTRKEFSQYLDHINKEMQTTSVNNHKRTIQLLYNLLVKKFFIEHTPIDKIENRKSQPKKNTPFTPQQFTDIISHVKATDPLLMDYIRFIIYGLLRTIEVVRIRAMDVQDGVIRIDTKSTNDDYIKIIDKLEPTVTRLTQLSNHPDDYLLAPGGRPNKWNDNEKYRYDHFQRRFKKVKDHFKLGRDHGLYSFRHNAAFALYRSFINDGLSDAAALSKTSELMRHKSTDVTKKYLRNIGATLPADYSHRFKFDL